MYNLNDLDMIFRKYEFASEEEAKQMIDALGVDEEGNATHKNSIVHLPLISDKYHIDVLWSDTAPSDWQPFEVWCKPVGMHVFANSEAVSEWTAKCKELHPEFFN